MSGSTFTWIGTTSDDPSDPNNWNPMGVPGPGDTAIIPGGTTVPPAYVDATLSNITFDLTNDGTLAFTNNTTASSTSTTDSSSTIDASGTATALSLAGPFTSSGIIEVSGTQSSLAITVAAGSEASGSFDNQGQIIVNQGDTLAINGGTFFDNGVLSVLGGIATVAATLEGAGNYGIGTGGTLVLDQEGTSATFTDVNLSGTGDLVKLDAPASFDGSISGFALGDTIDLGPVNVSTVVFDNQGDVIAIGPSGTVFDANMSGFGNAGTFVLSSTGGLAGDLQVTEGGGGDTVLTVVPPSTWLWSNGASAVANTTSDWSVVSGPGNGWGYPQNGDTAIDNGGTIVLGDSNFKDNTLELGGTAGVAALTFIGSSNTNLDKPTVDSSSVITSDVTSVGTFVGNSTPETSLLNAQGIFINEGTIDADGPAGSSFTIAVSGTMIDGTYQPGEFINYGLIQVDAGNTMTITVAGTSELLNASEIVVDGGTLVYNAATDAIVGGYAPGSGVVFIEDGGTVETNVTYASDVNGDIPTYSFAGTGTGNTLKIDNVGSFGGAILGFEANDTIDIGTSIDVTAIAYDNSTGVLSLESGGTIAASLLLATGNFKNYSGTVSTSGTTDGFIIGTSAADGDTIITTAVQNDFYDNSSGTWQTSALWSNGVPGTLDTAVIGLGASAPFTLTTGASPVSVGALVLAGDNTLLRITSDTTAAPYQIHEYGGTLEVTGGNTLTAAGMIVDGGQTTIDPTALLDLTGHQTYGTTGAIDGTIAATSYGAQALRIDSGSFLVNGGTLDAGPGQAGGGTGGRIYVGFEGGGTPATMTVQNSGTDAGVVTDTYAILASDPTSFGVLTLDGNVSWTDEIISTDTESNRGYMLIGYNNQATISGTLTPAFSGTATLVVENGATLTEQSYAEIGESVDSSGSVLVSGPGALWDIGTGNGGTVTGGFLDVGRLGDGVLTVEDGGEVEVGNSLVGFINNSTLLSASGINVGVSAGSVGTLDIESGGTVAMDGDAGISVGLSAQATGLIIVNGPSALLYEGATSTDIAIGKSGTGTLEIGSGGTVDLSGQSTTAFAVIAGDDAGGSGTIVVSGPGALLNSDAVIAVGLSAGATGLLIVSDGGSVYAQTGDSSTSPAVSLADGGTGTVVVTGLGSELTADGLFYDGRAAGSTGTLLVENQGSVVVNADLAGDAAELVVGVGNSSNGSLSGGSGSATITSGGVLNSGSLIYIGGDGDLPGTLSVTSGTVEGTSTVLGGTVMAARIELGITGTTGGGTGFLNIGSGALVETLGTTTSLFTLEDGQDAGSSGTVTVAGTLTTNGQIVVGNSGSEVSSGTPGATGLMTVDTGGTVTAGDGLYIGNNSGATGTVVVDGGAISTAPSGTGFVAFGVGSAGSGTLTIEGGGTVTATQSSGPAFDLAISTGSQGTATVTGTNSLLQVNGQLNVGDEGSGWLNINDGGVVDAGSNTVTIGVRTDGDGTVSVENGGTLIGGALNVAGIASVTGTLEIGSGGTVDVTTAAIGADGSLILAGGLLDPATLTLNAGGAIGGYGTLEANLDNGSSVTASGGVLEITGSVSGSGTMDIAPNGALFLSGTVLSGQIVDFTADTGILQLGTLGTIDFNGTIGSGGQGDIEPGDTIILTGVTNAATAFVNPINNVLDVVLTNTTTIDLQLDPAASFATDLFQVSTIGGNAVVTETGVPCFAAGTRILTPRGLRRVEELAVGDTVLTVLDRRPRPIVWIGHRTVDCTRHPKPQLVWPVCVSAGAFGRGLPARDLYLSPDHAVYAGGVLIPVMRLVNGETVTQVPCDSVTYYHIELTRHDVVLAEGLPAESFLDTGDRANFANGGRPVALYPDFSSHVREAKGCAELIVVGPKLDAVRARLNRIASTRRAASKRAA